MDTASIELKSFLFGLDYAHRQSAITRICDCCGVSKATIRNWYKGRSSIRMAYRIAINMEFNKQILSV